MGTEEGTEEGTEDMVEGTVGVVMEVEMVEGTLAVEGTET